MAEPLGILFYNDFWPQRPELSPDCPWPCRLLFDPSSFPVADVVIFHIPTLGGGLPMVKRPGQVWVAWSMESDVNYPSVSNPTFLRHFDLRMTYRRDADIWVPYLGPGMRAQMALPPVEKTADAPAVFISSNPMDRSGRGQYIAELMRYLRVDSYGRCLRNRHFAPDLGRTTKLQTITRYPFTLAFENSLARDYVTEKFFEPLLVGSVPVYLGAPNIDDFAPGEKAFVDVREFSGPAALAEYLKFLAENPDQYGEYLAWKYLPLRARFLDMIELASIGPLCRLAGLVSSRRETCLKAAHEGSERSSGILPTLSQATQNQPEPRIFPQALSSATAEPIDAVYCWVDSAEPAWHHDFEQHLYPRLERLPAQVGPHLFRNNDELRFSLRSLSDYAPWIGHVWLVTNGQIPRWLNRSHPGISLVSHEAIFPDPLNLPTFNSHAIELHLHRIPGLSRYFIYFNDDVFLGRPVDRSVFMAPDGMRQIWLDTWHLPTNPYGGPVHDRAYAYTQSLLDACLSPRFWRRAIAHMPQLYDRELIAVIQERWPREFTDTSSHRFRSPNDIALRVLYYHYALESKGNCRNHHANICGDKPDDYCFVQLRGQREEATILNHLLTTRPMFFCINDELDDFAEADVIRHLLRRTLAAYFPRPSPFELKENCVAAIR